MTEMTKVEIRKWIFDPNRATPVVVTTVTMKFGPLVIRRTHRHVDR